MAIALSKDAVAKLKPSLQRFFAEELELDLGDMRVARVLDYFLREIGPLVYNQAIRDAEKFVSERVLDLEGSCYEKEFSYWTDKTKWSK